MDGYPGWDRNLRDEVFFVMFEIVHNKHLSSQEMATKWDDTVLNRVGTDGMFCYRDWTDDNIPFIRDGEKYWSGFWFEFENDARAFHEKFGGAANWEIWFDQLQGKMQAERNKLCAYPMNFDNLERGE